MDVFPVYKVEYDCILSKHGDITLAFEVQLPEIFTLSDQEYEAYHQTLVKAIKVLPVNSIFHKQDWFLSKHFDGVFNDKVLSFLSNSSERFFNERPYLDHSCFIMLTRKPADRKSVTSLSASLASGKVVPDETVSSQLLQEFLDSAGQFERILQDSGFVKLRRLNDNELTGSSYEVGLLEQYCFLQPKGAVPMIKDISFKDGIVIGEDKCKLFSLADVEDLPALCGSRMNFDKYSTDRTKFSVGFASSLGQLLSCNHVYNQYIFIEDAHKTIKAIRKQAAKASVPGSIFKRECRQ